MCRSRRELSNEYLLAKIGVDTAENVPLEVWGENSIHYSLHSLGAYAPGDARSWEADLGDARSCALCGGKKDFESVPSFSQCQASQQLAEALHVLALCLKVFNAKH